MVTRRLRIEGKVQGVFFRQSTRQEAERLALRGSARNMPDGSVEVLMHGPVQAVEQLEQWLQHGPPQARVRRVMELDLDGDQPPPSGFEVA